MNKTVSRNRTIALTGALCALVVILGMPPVSLGMIRIGPHASITIMHIPVLLAAMLIANTAGLVSGVVVGAVFGIFSLIINAISPSGALSPLFVNPGVSVLPRMMLGVVAWFLWKLINLIPHLPKPVAAAITAFISTFAHTCMVIGALYVFAFRGVFEVMNGRGYFAVMAALLPNAIVEAIGAAIVCTAVIGAMSVAHGKKSKLSQEQNDTEE
ncbi:MAG: ECF transporter S component [Treponema sp.]|nr:ECF transporter S component [Treponema sp.]